MKNNTTRTERDALAAQFMAALITSLAESSRHRANEQTYTNWAKAAYDMADAILGVRNDKDS